MPETLTKEEMAVYMWQYVGDRGFTKALWQAIEVADSGNLERLRLGFPTEVGGFIRYKSERGWWANVLAKAKALGYPLP